MLNHQSAGSAPFRTSIPQNALIGALRVSSSTTMAIVEMHENERDSNFAQHVVRLIPDPENASDPTKRPRLFCPVPTDRPFYLGIGLKNHSSRYKAYPTYIGGANVYLNGNGDPGACTSQEMWELRPHQAMIISHLLDPNAQQGRRLVVTPRGEGYGIGEATYGTTEFAGRIVVYERDSEGDQYHHRHGGGFLGSDDFESRGDISSRGVRMGGTPKGLGLLGGDLESTRSAGDSRITRGPSRSRSAEPQVDVDIGAGAEQRVSHHDTGMTYSPTVISFPAIQLISEAEAEELYRQIMGNHRIERYGEINRSQEWWNVPNFTVTGAHIPMPPLPGHHRPHGK